MMYLEVLRWSFIYGKVKTTKKIMIIRVKIN